MISLDKRIDFDTFTKLPNNLGDLGKLIIAKGFESPKSNKSLNLVTLNVTQFRVGTSLRRRSKHLLMAITTTTAATCKCTFY